MRLFLMRHLQSQVRNPNPEPSCSQYLASSLHSTYVSCRIPLSVSDVALHQVYLVNDAARNKKEEYAFFAG